jgi:hypothetical protein
MWLKQDGEPAATKTRTVQGPLCGNRLDPAESQACPLPEAFPHLDMVVCLRSSHEFVRV